ncbi:MAG: hypothetical protein AAB919_02915 [Patescibacteria group bacterium]|mgnify:CR=1 FL=1
MSETLQARVAADNAASRLENKRQMVAIFMTVGYCTACAALVYFIQVRISATVAYELAALQMFSVMVGWGVYKDMDGKGASGLVGPGLSGLALMGGIEFARLFVNNWELKIVVVADLATLAASFSLAGGLAVMLYAVILHFQPIPK